MSVAALHWGWPVAGGLMIGTAAAVYLMVAGRVMGVSGLLANATGLGPGGTRGPSALFIAGLLAGTVAAMAWIRMPAFEVTASWPLLIVGGLLVGYGTRLGSGCTSGHGVCGLARRSPRSLAATGVFMATAALTVFVVRHVIGGGA
ncbi:YeeE/YedE family protein [Luteimonas sp. WGS1318]|uniref:YeeE/YedE family protein n=1 Tax=Luteimonas sp. WGS1318 TaxID=3366815 RepID=UPI00372D7B1A